MSAPSTLTPTRVKIGNNGTYAVLPPRLSHGTMKVVQRAYLDGQKSGNDLEAQTAILVATLREWNVKDEDGEELPINASGIDAAPQEVINTIWKAVEELIKAATPNP